MKKNRNNVVSATHGEGGWMFVLMSNQRVDVVGKKGGQNMPNGDPPSLLLCRKIPNRHITGINPSDRPNHGPGL
jgi:hypothetical protein